MTEFIGKMGALAGTLCMIAATSAVADTLLAGRRGAEIVGLMLTLAGLDAILTSLADVL